MAAPTPTARVTPTGRQLGVGSPVYVTFASDPNIDLWEKQLSPPGAKMDERKDNTTSYNTKFRKFSPGRLATMDDLTVVCGYDPDEIQDIIDLLGVRDTITIELPSGTLIAFYGWLDQYQFSELTEDGEPTVTLTIAVGNQDWDTCEEEPPVIVPGTGTVATAC